MLLAALAVALQLQGAPAPDLHPPPDIFSGTAALDFLSDDRESLRGIRRVLLSINVPDEAAAAIDVGRLRSTAAFRLEQAGIEVVDQRNVEDPILVLSVRLLLEESRGRSTGRVLYRVYADLLQLVRLADLDGGARLMLASTWHAGSFGAIDSSAVHSLVERADEVIDAFTTDFRHVNQR